MANQSGVLALVGQMGCAPISPVMPCEKEWLSFLNRTLQIRGTQEFKALIQKRKEKQITREEFGQGWIALLQTVSDV